MKIPFFLAALALTTATASAQSLITEMTRTYTVGANIDDVQNPPAGFLQTISDSAITSLTRVEIGLNLIGNTTGSGFASEMFVSLNKDMGQTAVLLNQVGVTVDDPMGQAYDGWDIIFRDDAANGDIHVATLSSGILSGTWAPDGRSAATDIEPNRPLMLSLFNSGSGNGDWRLLVGDVTMGGTMRLESWSITLTGFTAVPEPGTYAAVAGAGLLAFAALRKKL